MSINETLIGQMITFALFVWFTMRFVWPILEKVLKDREKKISEGLLAAERGHKELEISQKYAKGHIHEAKRQAMETIEQAKQQAALIVEQAKKEANRERKQIIDIGHRAVERERLMVKEQLQSELITVALSGTEKLLGRVMNETDQKVLLELGLKFSDQEE